MTAFPVSYVPAGYYMYIEASSPRVQGDIAKLNSPLLKFSGTMCLKFFYYMYGDTVNSLRVIINGTQTVFRRSGDKGPKWFEAMVTTSLSGMYMVRVMNSEPTILNGP